MEAYHDTFVLPRALHPLKIIIVGAGVAGLSSAIGLTLSGHHVSIYEQSQELNEVGAGIQMGPNAARVLGRFGLLEKLIEKGDTNKGTILRRWKDDVELGSNYSDFDAKKEKKKFSPPPSVIHRGDLQSLLLNRVKELNIPIYLHSKIISADPTFSARIQLATGQWISGDLVICADGIKSPIRKQIALSNGLPEGSFPTGDAAYRLLIPKSKLKNDKKALALLSRNFGTRWMGPGGHIMAYPIKHNTVYNMVLLHPQRTSQASNESWINPGSKKEMMEFYKDWNPMVRTLLGYVPDGEVMEWTLNSHAPLPSWFENRCVLVGDACHPMLPYVGQGAAQAIEDAGVLSCALSLISSGSEQDMSLALKVYELVRKERGEKIQNSAAETRTVLHLDDGEEQMKRDEAFRDSAAGRGGSPDRWVDAKWQEFMYGVDVMRECVDGWEGLVAVAKVELRGEVSLKDLRL